MLTACWRLWLWVCEPWDVQKVELVIGWVQPALHLSVILELMFHYYQVAGLINHQPLSTKSDWSRFKSSPLHPSLLWLHTVWPLRMICHGRFIHSKEATADQCPPLSDIPTRLEANQLQHLLCLLDQFRVCPGHPDDPYVRASWYPLTLTVVLMCNFWLYWVWSSL